MRKDEDMAKGDFAVKCPHCGANAKLMPTDEESKIHPSSIYGITKTSTRADVFGDGKNL